MIDLASLRADGAALGKRIAAERNENRALAIRGCGIHAILKARQVALTSETLGAICQGIDTTAPVKPQRGEHYAAVPRREALRA